MRSTHQLVVKMLNRIELRLRRARPGSVLILVVVLVVLLALLGTASLSTTQGDRYIATQNSANTQVDLIVQAGIEIAKSVINKDLTGSIGGPQVLYRPPETPTNPTDYDHFDAYELTLPPPWPAVPPPLPLQNDVWLSPRLVTAYPASPTQPWPMWSSLGRLPGFTNFDSPLTTKERGGPSNLGIGTTDLAIPTVYADRVSYTRTGTDLVYLMPNFVLPYGTADGRAFPAFVVSDPRGIAEGRFVIAGDTDGDGVADAGLCKFPIGEVDGVTYYIAARIIDNNSAVNINTAWSQISDFDFTPGPNPTPTDALGKPPTGLDNNLGNFPSHVGLLEMMHSPNSLPITLGAPALDEMYAVNFHRNNSQIPIVQPFDDTGGNRTDFNWTTRGEAYAFQLARRLANPGFVTAGIRHTPFEISDSAALAYRFTMQNRDASPSLLEGLLSSVSPRDSVYESAGNDDSNPSSFPIFGPNRRYYLASRRGIAAWFDDNFHFEGYTGSSFTIPGTPGQTAPLPHAANPLYERPLRALLTTHNPVSNQIPLRSWDGAGLASLPSSATDASSPRRLIHPSHPTQPYSWMPPYGAAVDPLKVNATKTNPNTATFEELWRAYWCVMMDLNPTGTPFTGGADQALPYTGMEFDKNGSGNQFVATGGMHSQRMFRSSLRDPMLTAPTKYFSTKDMVLLRSAIAAVQTMQLRGQDGNTLLNPPEQPVVYERIEGIPIQGFTGDVRITIFGTTPQPFLTEVLAWKDIKSKDPIGGGDPNTVPYVAVELYNPYPFPITLTDKYKIAGVDRDQSPYGTSPTQEMMTNPPLFTFSGQVIQPDEFLVIDNYDDMNFVPSTIMDEAERNQNPNKYISVSGLHQVVDSELELVVYQEIPDDLNLTPTGTLKKAIDSFDFHFFAGSAGGKMGSWHYARPCGGDDRWKCVYPGRYWVQNVGARQERHQGTDWKAWDPDDNTGAVINADPGFDPPYQPTIGRASGRNFMNGADPNYRQTVPGSLPIQLNNLDFGGPNKKIDQTGNKYPFGGFMRNGDLLQVPYIAAYTITVHTSPTDPGVLMDMNSVSMDAAFAEDSDIQDDGAYPDNGGTREQVGRFCPIRIGNPPALTIDDLGTEVTRHRYAWATDLFDYFSVNTPARDFLPEYPLQREWLDMGGQMRVCYKGNLYSHLNLSLRTHEIWRCDVTGPVAANATPADPASSANFTQIAFGTSVQNGKAEASTFGTSVAAETESDIGVQGLININTAPWKVLAAIPWVAAGTDRFGMDEFNRSFTTGGNGRDDNEDIARAIVYWRDGNALSSGDVLPNGPFRSLFDLYRVRVPVDLNIPGVYVFETVQNTLAASIEPDDAQGDFTPYNHNNPPPSDLMDHSRYDFEEQYLLLTKVGNLLTTRSDSFTVYIEVQGWRGVGTLRPELVVQRRAAFIHDRSKLTRANPSPPPTTPVPND